MKGAAKRQCTGPPLMCLEPFGSSGSGRWRPPTIRSSENEGIEARKLLAGAQAAPPEMARRFIVARVQPRP